MLIISVLRKTPRRGHAVALGAHVAVGENILKKRKKKKKKKTSAFLRSLATAVKEGTHKKKEDFLGLARENTLFFVGRRP